MAPSRFERLARKTREYTPHDESVMPMRLGSPYRTPAYSLGNWGLSPLSEKDVVDLYAAEWIVSTPDRMDIISQASERIFGDHPKRLRQETGRTVSEILQTYEVGDTVRILDVGAGPGKSAEAVYTVLPKELQERVDIVLLDPSLESLESAMDFMDSNGIRGMTIPGTDLSLLRELPEGTVDILTGVASIHHHSRIPFDIYLKVLKPGGWAVFADWHNSLWTHPRRVYEFLQQFDWPKKNEGLRNWLDTYPRAKEGIAAPVDPRERQANRDIARFWQACLDISKTTDIGPGLWPLEGHRPVQKYVLDMGEAGFTNIRSRELLPDSSLLAVTIGQRPVQ